MITEAEDKDHEKVARLMEAMKYEAPFLVEKLLKEQIVESAREGEALFTEVKRLLILDGAFPSMHWDVFSRRVDEAWHQFILFTQEYVDFCRRYFGGYLHHAPNTSSTPQKPPGSAPVPVVSAFGVFRDHYERLFGTSLSEQWYDELHITPRRRMVNEFVGTLTVKFDPEMASLFGKEGFIMSVSRIAGPALEFISQTGAFYVRELPGELTSDDKIDLVEVLVARQVLRVGV